MRAIANEREASMRWMWMVLTGLCWLVVATAADADSLWRDGPRGVLFTDVRATRLGDLVTVIVAESSSSNRTAETNLKKESFNKFNLANLFGSTPSRGQFDFTGNNEQKANGNITRQDGVTAQIPARVVKVLENGLLVVEGRRAIVVNDETQTLAFSGVVRPEDIGPDNVVQSTQVADAEVTVVGKGVLAEKQRPGILQRLFDIFRIF
jgi:flagellar L-ring protein precursor FlgH